jgi:PKD domain
VSKRRHLAASAIVVATAVALAPSAALASSSTSHAGTFVKSSIALTKAGSHLRTFSTKTSGLKKSVSSPINIIANITQTDAYSISVDPSDTTDSAPGATSLTYTYTYGDDDTAQPTSTSTHTYAQIGQYTVTINATDNVGNTTSTQIAIATAGSDYSAFGPTRLLDTRNGTGVASAGQVPAGQTVKLKIKDAVSGGATIPADVSAVVLNLTVTNAHGSGFVTAYADDTGPAPITSNVNYAAGQTVPNLVIVPVVDGYVDLLNGGKSAGAIDLVADVSGYFTPTAGGSGYTSLTPDRLIDTRNGIGVGVRQVPAGGTITVPIAGNDGGQLPSTGITAVALNVTVTNPKGTGFLTAYPEGESLPNASNVNYKTGQTIANSVIVPVTSTGKILITNSGAGAAGTDIIVDVTGYYSSAGASVYAPFTTPDRYLDTRDPTLWTGGPVQNQTYVFMPLGYVGGTSSDPTDDPSLTAFVMNATVTNTKGNGFLTVSPDPNTLDQYTSGTYSEPTPPNSSNLNWTPGETVPNLVQASTGSTGIIDVWNLGAGGGNTDLIIDLFGFYQDN